MHCFLECTLNGLSVSFKRFLNFILSCKQWYYELNPVKIISIILINCLLLTFVYGQSIAQVTQNIKATEQFKQIFNDFTLPYSYGKITSANYAGSDTVIINIQDLHLHPEAQKNISNIISTFDKEFGLQNIYLEGAYGQVDTSWLANIKDKDKKEKTINSIFATGALTGAEYYSAMSNKPTIIKGLESQEPYLNNLKRFGDILYAQGEITKVFNSMESNVRYLKSLYFNRKQNKIEELSKRYISGDLEAKKYFILLNKYADSLGVDLNKYENISLYIELLSLGRQIDYEKSTKELQLLILKLKELLPYGAYKMILDSTSDFSDIDRLYTYLVRVSRKNNIDLSVNFPELNKFFNYIELSEKTNPMEMLKEEQRLKEELNIAFAYDAGEKEIAFLSGFMPYLKDYLSSKITSDDYNYYENNIKKFKRLWTKYIDNQKLKSLSKYENTAETFYKINLDRNNYFIENIDIIKDSSKISKEFTQDLSEADKVIQSLKEAKNVSMVITGGFHTQGICELLKEQGISYVVITPNVSGEVKLAEDVYYALAKEQSKILFQALATLNLTQVQEGLKPVMLTEVLTQKGYTIEAINEALQTVLAQGETAQLTGSLNNLDTLELKISRNGQTTAYNYKDSGFEVKPVSASAQTQEEAQVQGNQKSRSSIWSSVKSFIAISAVSAAIVAGASVAIGLAAVTGFLWFLAPLILFGLLFIGNMSFMGYELYQDSFLAKEGSTPSDVPEGMTDVYMFKKLLQSLPQDVAKEFAAAALQVPFESVDSLLYGYASDLAKRLQDLNLTDVGAVMETGNAGIKINYAMIRSKFFDESGKNIVNQSMLEVFVKHELRHESFRTSTGFFGKFVHSRPWLEELIVSVGDLFTGIGNFFRNLFGTTRLKQLREINLNSYTDIEQSLTILLGRDSREISQKIQTFCMLNPNVNLTEEVFTNLGFSKEDAKVLAGVKFNLNVNTQSLNFEDMLSSSQPLELVKQLINTGNPDAVVVARAIELLGYDSYDTFEELKNIARSAVGDTSAAKFKELKETLIQKVNNNVVTEIIRNEQTPSEAFSRGFLTPQLISLQNMLISGDINENDIKDVVKSQAVSSFVGLFESLVRQKLTEKLYTSIESILPQEFKTQQTKDVLFNSLIDNLSFNLGNLTMALSNAKESLLEQIISKEQKDIDLLSVSVAQKGQNITSADKDSLATLDKNISNTLLEYSFSVVDQSQYNQQTAAFVNTVKDIFINENSWQQLQNNDTREKIANFLKQYYDSGIIDSNIRFLETITSKQEALGALSSLLTTLVKSRRIYNDVNLQRALVDLFPLTMQYREGEILKGEALILQASNDQEGITSDIKTYMLILAELNNFSTQDTPEKQRAQSLIANYGKYALSVLDYPINNGSVAFENGSRLRGFRTAFFNILKDMGVDVSNIEHPQDRLFEQQQPQLTQAEQERLLMNLPVEIENLETQTRETKNDKQLLKNLIDSQGKLDDAIFAGENVSASARRMVSTIRNIMQTVIDKGDFSLDDFEELKDIALGCRPMVLANNSDANLNLDLYDAMVIIPLDILIQQKSANAIDIKKGLSILAAAVDGLLRLQANFKAASFESFLKNKDDRTINFALKEGDLSNLYLALTFSRFGTVLNDLGSAYQTLTTDLETAVTSRQQTAIILERLRYWLPAGSAAKEFARIDLVDTVNDTISKFQEVLSNGKGSSPRITLANLNTLKSLQLAQSDYEQTISQIEQPPAYTPQERVTEATSVLSNLTDVTMQTESQGETQQTQDLSQSTPQTTEEQTITQEEQASQKEPKETAQEIELEEKPVEQIQQLSNKELKDTDDLKERLTREKIDTATQDKILFEITKQRMTYDNDYEKGSQAIRDYLLKEYDFSWNLARQISKTKLSVPKFDDIFSSVNLQNPQSFQLLSEELISTMYPEAMQTGHMINFLLENNVLNSQELQDFIRSVTGKNDVEKFEDIKLKLEKEIFKTAAKQFSTGTIKEGILGQVPPTTSRLLGLWEFASKLNTEVFDEDSIKFLKSVLNTDFYFGKEIVEFCNVKFPSLFINSLFVDNIDTMLKPEEKQKIAASLKQNKESFFDAQPTPYYLAAKKFDPDFAKTILDDRIAKELNRNVKFFEILHGIWSDSPYLKGILSSIGWSASFTMGAISVHLDKNVEFLNSLLDTNLYFGKGLVEFINLKDPLYFRDPDFLKIAKKILKQEELDRIASYIIKQKEDEISRNLLVSKGDAIGLIASSEFIRENLQEEIKYYEIVRVANDNKKLLDYLQDETQELRYRLYAFAQLKSRGVQDVDGVNVDTVAMTLKDGVKEMLEAKNLKHTESYFDLRALITGINLIASEKVIQEVEQAGFKDMADKIREDEQSMYQQILQADFIEGESFNADSSLTFVRNLEGIEYFGKDLYDAYYTVIAHELGHRYLQSLGFDSGTKARAMFHEQFADSVAGVFNSLLFQKDISELSIITSESKGFKVFAIKQTEEAGSQEVQTAKREASSQEEHDAARGLMNSIKAVLGAMGKQFNFRALLKTSIVLAIAGTQALFGVGQQTEVAKEVILGVSKAMVEVDPNFERGEFLYQFIKEEGVGFKNIEEEEKVFGKDAKGQQDLYEYLVAKHKNEKEPALIANDLYDNELRFIEKYNSEHIQERETVVEETQQKATEEKETKEEGVQPSIETAQIEEQQPKEERPIEGITQEEQSPGTTGPTTSVQTIAQQPSALGVLRKLKELKVIDDASVNQIESSIQIGADLVEEIVYQKIVQVEYEKIVASLPRSLNAETVKREIAKRISTYLRYSKATLNDLSSVANAEFAAVIAEQLVTDIGNNEVDNAEKQLQQLSQIYGLLSEILSKDEIDNIIKGSFPTVGAALVANNLTKLANGREWILRVAASLARFSVTYVDVFKDALNLKINTRNVLASSLNGLSNTDGLLENEYQTISDQLVTLYQQENILITERIALATSKEELNRLFNSLNTLEQNIRKSFFISETESLAEAVGRLSNYDNKQDLQKAIIITNLIIEKNDVANEQDTRDTLTGVENREKEMDVLARSLETLLKSKVLSVIQKQDIKQKLSIAQQEQINLINTEWIVNTQDVDVKEINKSRKNLEYLMRSVVVTSMDEVVFNINNVADLYIINKLNDFFTIDQNNFSNPAKIQELKANLFELIDKTNAEQVDHFNYFFGEIDSNPDMVDKKIALQIIVASIATNLASTANGNIEKLKFSAALSKMVVAITNEKGPSSAYTSEVIVDLASTLNKLVNALPRDSIDQKNIKNILATILQQEFSVTYGLSKLDSLLASQAVEENSKKLLKSSTSLEKMLRELNVSDKAQAIRYIRQRNMILKNNPNFVSSRYMSKEWYKETSLNLDELIAFTAPVELIEEQFPYDAGYFKILKVSQDNEALLNIMQDINKDLRYRLYAFAQLKSRGINEVNGVNVDNYIQTLTTNIKEMLQAKTLRISASYFDLRTLTIAINIVASSETIKVVEQAGISADNIKANEQKQYSNILRANFLQRLTGESINADSGMNFMRFERGDDGYSSEHEYFYEVIAHELGHTYLNALGFNSGILNTPEKYIKTQDRAMVHELTADLVSSVFNSFLLQTNVLNGGIIKGIRKVFNVFTRDFGILKGERGLREGTTIVQEGHGAARGLLNSVIVALEKMGVAINSETVFRPLLGAAISVAMTVSPTLFGEGQQNVIAKEIVISIANSIAESNPAFDKGELLYQFIQLEGASFNNFEEEEKVFGTDAKGKEALARYIIAKHTKPAGFLTKFGSLYRAEKRFLKNYQNEMPNFNSVGSNANIAAQTLQPILQPSLTNSANAVEMSKPLTAANTVRSSTNVGKVVSAIVAGVFLVGASVLGGLLIFGVIAATPIVMTALIAVAIVGMIATIIFLYLQFRSPALAKKERMLVEFPEQIENLERAVKANPDNKQAFKDLNKAQAKLDDMIFADQNVSKDTQQIVNYLRNIIQEVIDKGTVDQKVLDQVKNFIAQCKPMILASDSNLDNSSFEMMFEFALEALQGDLDNGNIKTLVGGVSLLLDSVLIKLSKVKNLSQTGINKFLQTENNPDINPPLTQSDISNLYIALTLSRLVSVLDKEASAGATLITDLETSIGTKSKTAVLLERLRYWLEAGSLSKEFARVDLVNAFKGYLNRYQEVLDATVGQSSTRTNQELLESDRNLVLAQSDYAQQETIVQTTPALNLEVPAAQQPSFVNQVATQTEGSGHSVLWYIGISIVTIGIYWLVRLFSYLSGPTVAPVGPTLAPVGPTVVDKLVEAANKLEAFAKDSTTKRVELLEAADSAIVELELANPTNAKEIELKRQACNKIAVALNKLMIPLSFKDQKDLKQKLIVVTEEEITLTKLRFSVDKSSSYEQIQTMFRQLMIDSVDASIDDVSLFHKVNPRNSNIYNKLNELLIDNNLFDVNKLQEIKELMASITSRPVKEFDDIFNTRSISKKDLNKRKAGLRTIIFTVAKILSDTANVDADNLIVSALLSKMAFDITDVKNMPPTTISQNVVTLANTLNKLASVYESQGNTDDHNNIKNMLSTMLQLEMSVTDGISQSDMEYSKEVLESRRSLEEILSKLNISDREQALRYIRQRNEVLMNEVDFIGDYFLRDLASKYVYKGSISNLDELIAFTAPVELIEAQFPYDAGYFKILRISQDNKALLNIMQDKTQEVRYRLYAFAQLKSRGVQDVDGVNVDTVAMTLKDGVKEMLEAKSLKHTESYFDLRVLIIGINLVASGEVIQEVEHAGFKDMADKIRKYEQRVYQIALQANFLAGNNFNADSDLNFVRSLKGIENFGKDPYEVYYRVIAHELGHRYLQSLGFDSGTKARAMFHEQFADSVAGVFNSFLFQKNISELSMSESKGFKVFAVKQKIQALTREVSSQEEHSAARGLMNSIKTALSAMGKQFNFRALLKASIVLAAGTQALFGVGQQTEVAKEVILGVSRTMVEIDPNFERGEFLHQFIKEEGVGFKNIEEEEKVFGRDAKGQQDLYEYLVAKHKHEDKSSLSDKDKELYEAEEKFINDKEKAAKEKAEADVDKSTSVALSEVSDVASARFTSIGAGILAFFNTAGFVALVVLLSLSIITGLGAVIAAAIGASVLAIIGTMSIMSSIYESKQKRTIKELGNSKLLSLQKSRLVFAKLVRSLPKETAIKFVQAVFDNVNLANDYLNMVSGTNWQDDIETKDAIINALNSAMTIDNSVVMKTTDTGRILFSPYIVMGLLNNNPTMLRVVVEHKLHHLEYAKSTSGLRRFIHRIFPGLEEFIVSFRNVFRWFSAKLQDSWREFRGVSVVWNLPEGLALGDILVEKVNEQGFIDAPNIQTGHVQLADGRRGTLSYKVTRNGLEVPNFEFGTTKFDAKDIGDVEVTYTFTPDTYTLSFATNDANATPMQQSIRSGETVHFDGVASVPQRTGYKFNGYRYVNSELEIKTITEQEVLNGFDIPSSDVTGDLKLQALWDAESSDVVFVGDTGNPIINVNKAAVTGQNIRIAGLGKLNDIIRLGNAVVGKVTGIKTQKITWSLPMGIFAPSELPSEIDDSVALNAPLIAEGRVELADGRFGTVERIVKMNGEVVENFQFGTTPINGALDIEYTFTPALYSINFIANGASANIPQVAKDVLSDGQLYKMNATSIEELPTKPGYLFKGYTYTTNDGRTINVSRMDVVKGFDINAHDVTGDINFVAQWDQKEEGEQYEVEFANASIESNVADNLKVKPAVFGQPYVLDKNLVRKNITDLTAEKWEVTGYVVSVKGEDIMKVDVKDINSIGDVTVPAQDVVGKLNIRFLRNPKVTFVDKFANTSKEEAVESGLYYVSEDLNEKIKTTSTKEKVPHWSRSDGKRLSAPITEPVTFTYSEEFHNITDYETQSVKPSSNIFSLIAKGIARIFKVIYNFIVSPTPVSKLTIIKNAYKNLSWQDRVRLVFSGLIMVSVIVLFGLFSGPGLLGLFFIVALVVAGAIFAVTLLGPVAKGYFTTVRDKASTEKERQKYAYYLEVLDFILGTLNSKVSTSKAFTAVKVITYFAITAIVALGFLAFGFGIALTSLWFVIAASLVFTILVVVGVVFLIVKYKTSLAFKLLVNVITDLFKSGSWKFKLNVAIGLVVSIGAFGAFLIAPIWLGISFIILLASLGFLVGTVVFFFTNNYNLNRLDQSLRNVLLENFASEDNSNAKRIKNIIGALEDKKWAALAWTSIALAVGDVEWSQIKQQVVEGISSVWKAIVHPIDTLKQVYQSIPSVLKTIVSPIQILKQVGQGILSAPKVLYNAIFQPDPIVVQTMKLITKGAYVFGKQWATEAIQNRKSYIYTSVTNAARRVQNAVVTYTTNVYDNMTQVVSSYEIPVREGFKFDGYEITSENSDITTIITAAQANDDFVVPANRVNGRVTIRVRWKPNISINTGSSSKNPLEADASNGVVDLGVYASLTPPAGYDYGTLYWTSDLFPERTFGRNESVMVDKPGSFTPHWKPLPQVKITIGSGNWKNRSEGETSTQREAQVVANALGGATVNLKKLSEQLQAPKDCDPDSLYWVSDTDLSTPIANSEVTATQDTMYIPRWKKLCEVGKAKIQTGESPNDFRIVNREKDGTIDLVNIGRDLKTPLGYKEGSLYWTSDIDPTKRFTNNINAEDAKNISVLTPHWEEDGQLRDANLWTQENDLDLRDSLTSHPIRFLTGVKEGEIDNIDNLPSSLPSGYAKSDPKGYTFPGFTNSWLGMSKYWTPQRPGYKFVGVKVEAKNRKNEILKTWNFDANPDGTMDAFNIDSSYAMGPLEITMQWISEQDFAKQQEEVKEEVKEKIRQEDVRKEQEFQKSVEEAKARREEQERKIREEQEKTAQEKALAEQKAAQERRVEEEKAEKSIGKTIPLQVQTGIARKVTDDLTSKDFPIKFGEDFHFPGLVQRGFFNSMGFWGSKKWMPHVDGFEFNGFEIVIGGKLITINKEEAINGFDIKKDDLQYKNVGEKPITIRPKWQRIETKQKSQETASEVALQAAQIASTLAIDTARITAPDKLAQLPLAVMSKFMLNMSEFENYQTEQIKIAQGAVTSLNYYMDIDDFTVLDMITNSLPFDVKDAFGKNVSISEDNTPGVVMSFNPNDGKIHVNYKMLRAIFFDQQGNIKNKDLLEVFVKHELRHRDYAMNQNQFSKMVHSISALEEFIVSIGDIYDWAKLHPELTSLQVNYEDAVATVVGNTALVAIAAKVGRQEAFNIAQMQSRLYYREIEDQVIDLVAPAYIQEPRMFNNADVKKSPRLIAVGGQIGAGSSELIQAQVLKDGGYSAALVEHMTQGVNVENYRVPVNTEFSVDGHEMMYDVYVREVNGIHVIGLKLKENINKELDTSENYARAVLAF
ncbi:MAG: hypothetical protein LBP57_02030, partial [Endomicrobium sp.]|nr:hypothetical protein [Endomicrobium sp.]